MYKGEQLANIARVSFFCQTETLDFFFLMLIVGIRISSAILPMYSNVFCLSAEGAKGKVGEVFPPT